MSGYDINIAFGEILRRFRKGRKYSQAMFAEEILGMDATYYGRIERGEHSISIEKCQQIAEALNIRVVDLFQDLPD